MAPGVVRLLEASLAMALPLRCALVTSCRPCSPVFGARRHPLRRRADAPTSSGVRPPVASRRPPLATPVRRMTIVNRRTAARPRTFAGSHWAPGVRVRIVTNVSASTRAWLPRIGRTARAPVFQRTTATRRPSVCWMPSSQRGRLVSARRAAPLRSTRQLVQRRARPTGTNRRTPWSRIVLVRSARIGRR